jgi:hypothetical protein
MNENEMSLDDPATRRDVKELRGGLKSEISELRSELKSEISELRGELAKRPTQTQIDASFRQVMVHIDTAFAQHVNAILEDVRKQIAGLDDRYHDLPERVTKLETAVFSPPPKRKRKAS